jgi:hypothetical protein
MLSRHEYIPRAAEIEKDEPEKGEKSLLPDVQPSAICLYYNTLMLQAYRGVQR